MRKGDPQDHSHRVYKPEPVPQRTRGVPDGAGLLSASGSRDSPTSLLYLRLAQSFLLWVGELQTLISPHPTPPPRQPCSAKILY